MLDSAVLRVTAFVGYALLAVETVLGSLWALSGEFQAYMSFFH